MLIIQDPEDVEEFAEGRRIGAVPKGIPARVVKCLFCGKAGLWWECNCQQVQEVRAGKRAKPRVVFRDGEMVIIVDRETVEANHFGLRKYADVHKPRSRKTRELDPVNTAVHRAKPLETKEAENPVVHTDEPVNTDPVHESADVEDPLFTKGSDADVVDTGAVHKPDSVNTEDARKAYRREWMRRKREGV